MLRRLAQLVWERLRGEEAQATVEYALVVAVTVALLLTISGAVIGALSSYYFQTTSVVCLPLP